MTAVFKIDTSEFFCFHHTPLRQGTTGTAGVLFPDNSRMIPIQNHNKSGTLSVLPYLSAHPKKGRARRSLSKVCPTGTRRNFVEVSILPLISKLLSAFDRQSRSPTIPKPKGTKMSCEGNKMRGLFRFYQHELRFCWGLLTAAFVVKREGMW